MRLANHTVYKGQNNSHKIAIEKHLKKGDLRDNDMEGSISPSSLVQFSCVFVKL
jgi:hypothetical protein